MDIFPLDEVKRKSFHLLSIIYILAYWALPKMVVLWGLGAVIVIVVLGEGIRLRISAFNKWILYVLGGVHRMEEENNLSGLPWTLAGSFFTILFFHDRTVVLVSLLYLALGDASAALIGRCFGKHRIARGKSIEGSLACFCACCIVGLFFLKPPLIIIGALIATLIELIPWPLNDNFWMPLASATILTLLMPLIV